MQCIASVTLNQMPLGALEAHSLRLLRGLRTLLVVLNLGAHTIHWVNRQCLLGCLHTVIYRTRKGAMPLSLGMTVSHAVQTTLAICSQHFQIHFITQILGFTFLPLLNFHLAAITIWSFFRVLYLSVISGPPWTSLRCSKTLLLVILA